MTDTIAAVATAAGAGGVGIIRLSGPRAIAIAADALGIGEASLDRSVRVGWAKDTAGERIDQVLAFAMRAPASFTGEDVAELHGHDTALRVADGTEYEWHTDSTWDPFAAKNGLA